jgi:hypothetical protein
MPNHYILNGNPVPGEAGSATFDFFIYNNAAVKYEAHLIDFYKSNLFVKK